MKNAYHRKAQALLSWPTGLCRPHRVVSSRMLDIGVVGLGSEWERRFRPALLALHRRMRVRAIQASVAALAEQAAAEWRCDPCTGMLGLMRRRDVRAVLILGNGWRGSVPAEFACLAGKPAFLAGPLADWVPRAQALAPLATKSDTTLMPDFGHRYTPVTTRLKELAATRLGRPDSVAIQLTTSEPAESGPLSSRNDVLAAVDWAIHLVATNPAEVRGASRPDGTCELTIGFQRPAAGGAPPSAHIAIGAPTTTPSAWTAEVRCRKGIARLNGLTEIEWEDAAERRQEMLGDERAEVEVMLDHFSRRVVGGLIPVPTLEDLLRAARLIEAATTSLRTGQTLRLG